MFRQLYATAQNEVTPADSDDPVHVWITCLFVLDDPSSPAPASEPFRRPPRKERAMGFGWVFLLIGVLWAAQLAPAHPQPRGGAVQGSTVFANARPVPALVGLPAAELAAGAQVAGLAPRVLAAAHS